MTEQDAIKRLQQGDISGLQVLVEQYQLAAVKTAILITRNQALAEEVVQAAFLRVYQRAEQFDSNRPFAPWFLRIVANDAVKTLRNRWREVALEAPTQDIQPSLAEVLPTDEPGPVEAVLATELGERVQLALDRLTPQQRAVIVMRYYLDMTGAEMAKELGVSERAVKGRLTRAREQLKELLDGKSSEVA